MAKKYGLFCLTMFVFVTIQLFMIYLGFVAVFKTGGPWKYYKDVVRPLDITATGLSHDSDITIVSAFFDIGNFSKRQAHRRDKETYYRWMGRFKYVTNSLVFFTDTEESIHRMTVIRRAYLEKTKIIKINRSSLWPFRHYEHIQDIFNTTVYSNYTSIYPIYICVTHSKYHVMKIAAEENVFGTRYIMWMDIGYFRRRSSANLFHLSTPKGFDTSRVAMTQVFINKSFHVLPKQILYSKNVIVSGALFLGECNQIIKFVTQFRRAVEYFLKQNVTNTDEQIIYAMYSTKSNVEVDTEVKLQMYPAQREKDWFYIGYTMINEH